MRRRRAECGELWPRLPCEARRVRADCSERAGADSRLGSCRQRATDLLVVGRAQLAPARRAAEPAAHLLPPVDLTQVCFDLLVGRSYAARTPAHQRVLVPRLRRRRRQLAAAASRALALSCPPPPGSLSRSLSPVRLISARCALSIWLCSPLELTTAPPVPLRSNRPESRLPPPPPPLSPLPPSPPWRPPASPL